ncbi:uncharacterized protein LOC143460387 isoform X2 [Clavelina lepadiformis]|uniref:uncharacterized protein LOC143460387 isoform X2 n=1 Tax=Clavelina lepadiformis TaxID=159417 RepID=UPI00404194DC
MNFFKHESSELQTTYNISVKTSEDHSLAQTKSEVSLKLYSEDGKTSTDFFVVKCFQFIDLSLLKKASQDYVSITTEDVGLPGCVEISLFGTISRAAFQRCHDLQISGRV